MRVLLEYASDIGKRGREKELELETMDDLLTVIEGERAAFRDTFGDMWPHRVLVARLNPGDDPRYPQAVALITVYDGWLE